MDPKDKRVKREIANSNERRRMQSINAGFQKLKRLLPVSDGEKLSKAAILQQAADFVQQIQREKLMLFEQNTLLRGVVMDIKSGADASIAVEAIDLDSLTNIPINTQPSSTTNDSTLNNSNDSHFDNNSSNDDSVSTRVSTPKESIRASSNSISVRSSSKNANKDQGKNGSNVNSCETTTTKNNHRNNYNQEQSNQHISTTATTIVHAVGSDRVISPKNGLAASGVAKAAIALPLEVPYTSLETAIRVEHHQPHDLNTDAQAPPARKMIKTEPSVDSQDPAPKGQTLDTICKAIMEIEGDRVFTG